MQSEPVTAGRLLPSPSAAAAYGAALAASVLVWLVLRSLQGSGVFPYDDSYITLHAAQALHLGYDPNFPGVSPLFGQTSAPFLALAHALICVLPPPDALSLACWLGIAAYSLGLAYLCRTLRLGFAESAAIVLLGLVAGNVPMHLLNGLETPWALAAIAWTLALASAERRLAAAFATGITASLRPEMSLFALCIVAALCIQERASWRRSLSLIALAALPVLPVCIWYLHATSHPFPMTGIAKRYFFAEDQDPLGMRMGVLLSGFGKFALSCGVVALALFRVYRSAIGIANLVFVCLLLGLALTLPGSIAWNFSRYLAPLVPLMVWACAVRLARASAASRPFEQGFLMLSVLWAVALLPHQLLHYSHDVAEKYHNLQQEATVCREHLPPNAIVLAHDVGYIGYATHFRVVDMVGLKTPEAIEINREITWPSGGENRAAAIARLARQQHATHMVLLRGWLDMDSLPDELRALNWMVEPLSTSGAYRVYRIAPPGN